MHTIPSTLTSSWDIPVLNQLDNIVVTQLYIWEALKKFSEWEIILDKGRSQWSGKPTWKENKNWNHMDRKGHWENAQLRKKIVTTIIVGF